MVSNGVSRHAPSYYAQGRSHLGSMARYAYHNRAAILAGARDMYARRQASQNKKRKFSQSTDPTAKAAPGQHPSIRFLNVVDAQAHRASMKTTGSKNVKGIRGKKHGVKVSKTLRDKVNKVIEAKKHFGVYKTTRHLAIGTMQSAAITNSFITNNVGAYANARLFHRSGLDTQLSNCRWWSGAGLTNNTVVEGDDFNLFTPMKFMDAASILWNNKIIQKDYAQVGGNFVIATDPLTGGPQANAEATPNAQMFKLHIVNSYVKFELKNTSQRQMRITIYNITLKLRHTEKLPLDVILDGLLQFEQTAAARLLIRSANDAQAQDALFNDPEFPITMVPPFNESFKFEKMDMVMSPGETCVHYVKGPKNYDLDYTKLYADAEENAARLFKGTSCSVLFSVRPDLVYGTAGIAGNAGAGRAIFGTGDSTLKTPISIEMVETFKLSIPENAGFYQQATPVAGAAKVLNLRRPQYAFGNFTNLITESTVAYSRFDEENVAGVIAPNLYG